MRSSLLKAALLTSSCFQTTSAWYLEVHNQIGYMADALLNDNTRWLLHNILEPEYQDSIGRAAGWADTVSKTTAKYSYGWHWISANDNPPEECGLYYHRDCQDGGCVVQQIANQTKILTGCVQQLAQGQYTPDVDCQQALKWTIHFVMDVCEPMHTSLKAYGGNTFKVLFNGTETNMHQTWDRWILYAGSNHPNGFSSQSIDPYFSHLLTRIQQDQFRVPKNEWAMCNWDFERGTYCPERWAQDSNAIVCDYAYGRYVNGTDLYESGYAAGAFHIVENQLAKAAWRLAGWLNTLAQTMLKGSLDEEDVVDESLPGASELGRRPFVELPGADHGQIVMGRN